MKDCLIYGKETGPLAHADHCSPVYISSTLPHFLIHSLHNVIKAALPTNTHVLGMLGGNWSPQWKPKWSQGERANTAVNTQDQDHTWVSSSVKQQLTAVTLF